MSGAATDTRHRELGLTDAEYDRIVELLEREPGDLELAVFSLMWSRRSCSARCLPRASAW